jgi:hypothetical protein
MNRKSDLELKMKKLRLVAPLAMALAAVGCQQESTPLATPVVTLPPHNFDPGVDAGWKAVGFGDAKLVADLKLRNSGNHGQSFAPRNDPFALLREERAFDVSQSSERLLGEGGGFTFDYEPPVPRDDDAVIQEPQPYRRLAGVIVGESVLALIDMGDGRLEIIRPGQRIPNSEWTVVSIDEEKAVLRRGGNRLPRQIVVRLESPPFNPNQGGGGGGGAPGNMPGGGTPGRGGLGPPGGPGSPSGAPGGDGDR